VSDTKEKLMDAAETAARHRGFDGFSYADLAADVGIRKASIHHHFATKAALATALIDRYSVAFDATCAEIATSRDTGSARLEGLISRYRDAVSDGQSLCLCVAFSASIDSLPPEVIEKLKQFRAMMINWIEQFMVQGQADGSLRRLHSAADEAPVVLACLEGAQLAARAERNAQRFDVATATLRQRLR